MKMNLVFNTFNHWLHKLWLKQDDSFIDYIGYKYCFDDKRRVILNNICQVVKYRKRFNAEDLKQIQELGIPLGQIDGFNLSGFRERTSPVSYDTFVTYLVNICDKKFTKQQIKQTIENDSIASKSNNIK